MKILHALNSGKPGGMEQHVLDLVKCMVAKKQEVFVWCNEGVISEWYKTAGARVSCIDISYDVDPFYIFKLTKFLKENKIEVLHCHELKAVGNGLLAGFFAGTKVRITHIHTPFSEWKINNFVKTLYSFFYSIAVKLFSSKEIALTESRKRVKINEGITEDKLCVIPNAVEIEKFEISQVKKDESKKEILDKFKVSETDFVLGCVGRMTVEKGHAILINAFKDFINIPSVQKENVCLILAGGGVLEIDLKKRIVDLNLEESVFITGIFDEADKTKYYSSFDVFIFPSLAEGFGIVLTEAMASGLPVLCSDLDVLQEVSGGTALYFKTGDSKDLTQKLYDIYLRREKLENLGESAKERVKKLFSMQKFCESYEDLYLNLLEKK